MHRIRSVIPVLALVVGVTACGGSTPQAHGARTTPTANLGGSAPTLRSSTTTTHAPTTAAPSTTTTVATAPTGGPGQHGPITSPPLPAPGPGFVAGHVTAVGDSVMLDYQDPLQADIPGIDVEAAVSRQWSAGEAILQQLKSAGQLGAVVIVGLSTNGPITATDFDTMMGILQGASRVVFVTVHVDQPWQDANNAVLEAGAARYRNVVIADWATLADQNPQWLYSDETHLPIDGPGADALAALVASKA